MLYNSLMCEIRTHDGLILKGSLKLPHGSEGKKVPVVLFLVGSGRVNRYEAIPREEGVFAEDAKAHKILEPLERALLERGIASFAYDKRGIESMDPSCSEFRVDEERFDQATASNLYKDALAAFDTLQGFEEIDPSRMAILGHSEGTLLANRVAEVRPELHSLFLFGTPVRPLSENVEHQLVAAKRDLFDLIKPTGSEFITRSDYEPFAKELGWAELTGFGKPVTEENTTRMLPYSWEDLTEFFDAVDPAQITREEWRGKFQSRFDQFLEAVGSDDVPWNIETVGSLSGLPRLWFREYFEDGSFLKRHAQFAHKTYIYQGETDTQTLYQEALALKEECEREGKSLAKFRSYPGLGHFFSRNAGLRQWRRTLGPLNSVVANDFGNDAAFALLGGSFFPQRALGSEKLC